MIYFSKREDYRIATLIELHEPHGKRILGNDKAHAEKPLKNFKFSSRRMVYDHKHLHGSDKGGPYEFEDDQQLSVDSFAEVDRALKEIRQA